MFRNQYDNDVTTWSPQGRIHQVEYAMEAVKQGSAVVGIRSKTHAVLVALKRAPHDLASYQKKILFIDDHIAIAIAGLTSDARVLSNYMRSEALKSKMLYNRPLPVSRIVNQLGIKAQGNTQGYSGRPYGVGFLIIGHDETGPHLFEANPSGNNFEYFAMALGSRSQSAKTYLERQVDQFQDATKEELIRHALIALHDTLPKESTLTAQNTSIAIVGIDEGQSNVSMMTLEDDEVTPYLENLDQTSNDEAVEGESRAMDEN